MRWTTTQSQKVRVFVLTLFPSVAAVVTLGNEDIVESSEGVISSGFKNLVLIEIN